MWDGKVAEKPRKEAVLWLQSRPPEEDTKNDLWQIADDLHHFMAYIYSYLYLQVAHVIHDMA